MLDLDSIRADISKLDHPYAKELAASPSWDTASYELRVRSHGALFTAHIGDWDVELVYGESGAVNSVSINERQG